MWQWLERLCPGRETERLRELAIVELTTLRERELQNLVKEMVAKPCPFNACMGTINCSTRCVHFDGGSIISAMHIDKYPVVVLEEPKCKLWS